jgi:hypothetical protein
MDGIGQKTGAGREVTLFYNIHFAETDPPQKK